MNFHVGFNIEENTDRSQNQHWTNDFSTLIYSHPKPLSGY
uniref:Uncharacterized protein n=1 Tax=Arundo donax TaxID=35708 RepID=A0A0A9E914_ARUDO